MKKSVWMAAIVMVCIVAYAEPTAQDQFNASGVAAVTALPNREAQVEWVHNVRAWCARVELAIQDEKKSNEHWANTGITDAAKAAIAADNAAKVTAAIESINEIGK